MKNMIAAATPSKRWMIATAALLAAASASAVAGERGKFQGHSVLVAMKFNEHKAMEGHPLKSAMSGELDGLVFNSGGGSALDQLLDRAHYHVVWSGDGAGGSYCLKTFTTGEGHKLYARCEGKSTATGATGTITLLGGSGPFAGIKGTGKLNFVGVTERVFWDDIEWDWEKP